MTNVTLMEKIKGSFSITVTIPIDSIEEKQNKH